jgi:hypothetical protein
MQLSISVPAHCGYPVGSEREMNAYPSGPDLDDFHRNDNPFFLPSTYKTISIRTPIIEFPFLVMKETVVLSAPV